MSCTDFAFIIATSNTTHPPHTSTLIKKDQRIPPENGEAGHGRGRGRGRRCGRVPAAELGKLYSSLLYQAISSRGHPYIRNRTTTGPLQDTPHYRTHLTTGHTSLQDTPHYRTHLTTDPETLVIAVDSFISGWCRGPVSAPPLI